MITFALLLTLASPAPEPLSVYAPHWAQVNACVHYMESGDPVHIAVDVGDGEIGTLECEDYPDAIEIVAHRARDRVFWAWYQPIEFVLALPETSIPTYRKIFALVREAHYAAK